MNGHVPRASGAAAAVIDLQHAVFDDGAAAVGVGGS